MTFFDKALLTFILLVAAVLRFYNFGDIPFTHDEFSAIFRLKANSFSELIATGVKPDGHPAGVQVFLFYWTKIFGTTEWIVKLPFTMAGILSIPLIFSIGKNWFGKTTGFLSAAFLASLQYSVMYSQIARPYISGMFLCLVMVFFWTRLIKQPEKRFYLNAVALALSAAACAYNHHFSFLFAILVGISGLFFIQRKYLVKYVFIGITAAILYLPHINIFIYQLNKGGVEGWLAKPDNYFLLTYLSYIFHFSLYVIIPVIVLILWGLFKREIKQDYRRNIALFTLWFLLPIAIGFIYSTQVNAVLQYSVLIFSFPFLFLVLFGHFKELNPKATAIAVLMILLVNSLTLIFVRQHYNIFYVSQYQALLHDHEDAHKQRTNTISLINSNKPITRVYLERDGIDSNFIWLSNFKTKTAFLNFLGDASKKYGHFYFGCTSETDPELVQIIQDYFPKMDWQRNYFGATAYLFSSKIEREKSGFYASLRPTDHRWTNVKTNQFQMNRASKKLEYAVLQEEEWTVGFQSSLSEIMKMENDFIDVRVKAKLSSAMQKVDLVLLLESNGQSISWNSISLTDFPVDSSGLVTAYQSLKLSDINHNHPNIVFKTLIWNLDKEPFLIQSFEIKQRDGNPILYSINEPIYN